MSKIKETKFIHGLISIIFLISSLYYGIQIAKIDVHIPILMSAFFIAGIAIFILKYPWKIIEEGIIGKIFLV